MSPYGLAKKNKKKTFKLYIIPPAASVAYVYSYWTCNKSKWDQNPARISARNRRKAELKNLVSSYKDMDIKAFMEMAVVYYNDNN